MPRIRLASVEPWDLPENFFTLFQDNRLMPHMHLPLQSGSDAILKAMARRCKTAHFARLINQARSEIPGFNVTTDIIVGFPGESEYDWRQGLEFIETTGFSHVHVFPYSSRAGTRAAALPDHVPTAVKKDRCQQLLALTKKMKKQCLQQQLGKRTSVLIENIKRSEQSKNLEALGYTPDYYRVQLEMSESDQIKNEIRDVSILSLNKSGDGLIATSH